MEIATRVTGTERYLRKAQIPISAALPKSVCKNENLELASMSTGATGAKVLLRLRGIRVDRFKAHKHRV